MAIDKTAIIELKKSILQVQSSLTEIGKRQSSCIKKISESETVEEFLAGLKELDNVRILESKYLGIVQVKLKNFSEDVRTAMHLADQIKDENQNLSLLKKLSKIYLDHVADTLEKCRRAINYLNSINADEELTIKAMLAQGQESRITDELLVKYEKLIESFELRVSVNNILVSLKEKNRLLANTENAFIKVVDTIKHLPSTMHDEPTAAFVILAPVMVGLSGGIVAGLVVLTATAPVSLSLCRRSFKRLNMKKEIK